MIGEREFLEVQRESMAERLVDPCDPREFMEQKMGVDPEALDAEIEEVIRLVETSEASRQSAAKLGFLGGFELGLRIGRKHG